MSDELKRLNKIVDTLEQRIATLEKVLESHAKCIGEIREEKDEWIKILPRPRLPYWLWLLTFILIVLKTLLLPLPLILDWVWLVWHSGPWHQL